jgi:nucleoside-diphosphate-sugar epimerase
VRVLVTGADGFVGRHLVRHLLHAGDEVAAACRPGRPVVDWDRRVEVLPLEMAEHRSIQAALSWRPDAIVHLAAVASVRQARDDPGAAWEINAAGTGWLESRRQRGSDHRSHGPGPASAAEGLAVVVV